MRQNYYKALFLGVVLVGAASFTMMEKTDKQGDISIVDPKVEAKIDSLIKQMTIEEKITMLHASSSFTSGGVPRLGIPELVMSDGPHGVRKEHGRDWVSDNKGNDSATYLPTGMALAASWNVQLGYEAGKVLGEEANARGKDVILGPGVNILRSPLNGRNFEYLSEDPYLASRMAVGYIKGVQETGVSACVKHYLANNQEFKREFTDVVMSERALREIYLPAFVAAITEGKVHTVMGAYNQFRGQYCTHNEYLVNGILKGELGFRGLLMSDWGAVHNTIQAAEFGTDLEMGSEFTVSTANKPDYNKFYMADTLLKLVKKGTVKESLIDDKVRRILRVMIASNTIDKSKRKPGSINTPEHQALTRKIAEEAITLLKNENNLLPLKKTVKTVAVIGLNGDKKQANGGGSSQVLAKYEITPLKGIKNLLGSGVTVKYHRGYKIKKGWKVDADEVAEALAVAKGADVVIYVGGFFHGYSDAWEDNAYDAENTDKPDMKLPFGQDTLLSALLNQHPNMVVVLMGGGPTDMSGFIDKTKAIVQMWYPGMEGGTALAKILFGEVNPSGKLPMTFPKKLEDSPAHKLGEFPGDGKVVRYNDDIWVGYRYFDTKKVEPLFPFGFGLSYTKFEFSGLKLQKNGTSVTVKVSVKNIGKMAGAEVVQIYVHDEKAAVERPEKELKGFDKVFLKAGEKKEVTITLDADAFKYYDETKKGWVLEPGKFTILAGSSAKDVPLKADVDM